MRMGRLALTAIAVPVAAKALRRVTQSIQAHRGNSPKQTAGLDAYSRRSRASSGFGR